MDTLKLTLDGTEVGVLVNPHISEKGTIRADRVEFRMNLDAAVIPDQPYIHDLQLETVPPIPVHIAGWSTSELREDGILVCLFPWMDRCSEEKKSRSFIGIEAGW